MKHADIAEYGEVAILRIEAQSNVLVGYAAPRMGPKPAALALESDGVLIASVRASRYSPTAADGGVRVGWCGFELPGLAQAFALGSRVTVSCVKSGKLLEQLAFNPTVFDERRQPSQPLSAAEVFAVGSLGERCADYTENLPFAIDHRNRHVARSFLEATYQMLLDRVPGPYDYGMYEGGVATDDGLIEFLDAVVASDEYAQHPLRAMPGPFHPAFRYDRGLLG